MTTTLVIEQKTLVDALTALAPAIGKRSTLPILQNVKIEATADGATLTATDLEVYASYTIPALVETEGATTVSYKELVSLVKPLKNATILLSAEIGTLTIEAAGMTAPLATIDASEFPVEPQPQEKTRIPQQTVTLPVTTLRQMVDLVWYAADPNCYKSPVFAAICVSLAHDRLRMVAADSFRMSVMQETVTGAGNWPFALLIPAGHLHKIVHRLPKSGDVTISAESSAHATLTCGPLVVHFRLIEGTYPNIDMVIPRESSTTALADTKTLASALKSVELIAKDSANITRLHMNGAIEVTAKRDGMKEPMSVHVPARTAGEEMDILLNWRYLSDVLTSNPTQRIQLACTTPTKPTKVTIPDLPGYVGVIMSMHLNR